MEEWTTPKQVSAAMLIMAFAVFPQILSVPKSDWSDSLDLAVACFATGIPLCSGYFLRSAQMQSPHGNFWRNLHDGLWVLSVATTIAGVAATFYHLGQHHANSFLWSILLAVVVIFVGARADGEWAQVNPVVCR
jgi:hypothetical protein